MTKSDESKENGGRMKKSARIILALIHIITVGISTVLCVVGMRAGKEKEGWEQYGIISSIVYEAVENELSKPIITSLAMSNDILLQDLLNKESSSSEQSMTNQMARYLSAVKESVGARTAFLISEGTKRYYTYEGLNKVIDPAKDEHDIWYSIFANKRKPYDLDVDVDQVNGDRWTVFVNARIEDGNGKFLGVCGIGLSMERLQEILLQYEKDYNIKVNFIDSDGLVQVDTDAVNIESAYLHDVQYGKEKDGYAYKNKDGEYVVMRFVDNLNWYLVIHGECGTISTGDVIPILAGAACVIMINLLAFWVLGRTKKEAQ